ncbi:uncharacterized protein LOC114523420 [Dendronephthya gigantea]|uniref:uncharacterized protein LOC114523420 n=1 Tax=Dendronephthya gigantea TaxID=151771 RepID=UPI00106B4121|nr:uncharacterized protein LOC114523420 [Dendronephthya gigantea]
MASKMASSSTALNDSPSLKVVKKLCNRGLVSLKFLKNFKEKFGAVKAVVNSKRVHRANDEEYWLGIRKMFAYDEDDENDALPINAANLAPTFNEVQLIQNEYFLELNKNIAIQNRLEVFGLVIDEARALIANQLGVNSDEIAIMRNATEANNNIINGQLFKPTDEVVIWEQNHGSDKEAWYIRQQQQSFKIPSVPYDLEGATSDSDIVNEFMKFVNEHTKYVTFSHLSNVGGRLLPAEAICKAVHSKFPHCHVHVDGAQTWGCMDMNLAEMDCDSYASSSHKWFFGPKETGILFMKKSRIKNFYPNTFGYDLKINLPKKLYHDARRFETLGTRSDPSLMCLLNTAEILGDIGYQAIEARVRYLGTLVYDGFKNLPNFPMTTPANESQRIGVIVADVEPQWGQDLYNYLYDYHRIAVSSTGGIRISPTISNMPYQISYLLAAVEEFILKNPPPPRN